MFDERTMLVTGGSGLLGTALKKLFPLAMFPSKEDFDVTNFAQMEAYLKGKVVDTIFHGAAFTSPPEIEQDPMKAVDVNIIGTSNLVKLASKVNAFLIYISTDYVFKGDKGNYSEDDSVFPVNKYAWSKLGAECALRLYDKALIIRTTFGPDIFPYDKAFTDQWTSRECVTKTATMIAELIKNKPLGVVHIGGNRKSVYEYATNLNPAKEIGKMSIQDISFKVPVDTSLNIDLYQKLTRK